ncbi:MAG: DUF4920 domain-containing protein [bacterium]|nr:DUF4920 domain-containing protein [bacterium]
MRAAAAVLLLAALPALAADAPPRRMGKAVPLAQDGGREVYGTALPKGGDALGVPALLGDAPAHDGKPVRVAGTVSGVCQKVGCWLQLRDGDQTVRVRFRDYAFFVPLDVSGREAIVEGTAQVSVVTQAERRHLAEDAGRSAAEIDAIRGDETVVQVIADAVEILPARP